MRLYPEHNLNKTLYLRVFKGSIERMCTDLLRATFLRGTSRNKAPQQSNNEELLGSKGCNCGSTQHSPESCVFSDLSSMQDENVQGLKVDYQDEDVEDEFDSDSDH